VLEHAGQAMTPIEIDRAIRATGRTMHQNAVTSHLSRLLKDGRIKKTGPSLYAAIEPENQHDSVAGNGQLDREGQEQYKRGDIGLSGSSYVPYEESNSEEQSASPDISGEAL
jgi:hypothetical protein